MIPRTLVPVDVRPVKNGEAKAPPRRLETYMDERTLVPAGLPDANLPPLDGRTSIPAHLPLDSLVARTLVPRGMPAKPIEKFEPITDRVPVAVLDERVVVPAYVEPLAPDAFKEFEHTPEMTPDLREVIEPDIFLTGDANLLIQPEGRKDPKWDALMRALSVAAHIALLAFVLLWPKIFPYHAPSEEDIKNAQRELNFVYMPPEKPVPPAPTPKLQMNREMLKRVVPELKPEIPAPAPIPAPTPERPPSDLPEAPKPRIQVSTQPAPNQVPTQSAPSHLEPVLPAQPQNNHLNLGLSQASPGKALDNQLSDAINRAQNQPRYGGGAIAPGGASGTGLGQGVQILSDTQGVDFNPYIKRLLATLYRNWVAVMPESARWDKGVVFTTFQINPDGSVPAPDPTLERTSGKQPLDNAAMSAIHASNPFEPLPSAFHGPYLRLRIAFLYNIPPDQINFH
jgi:outer membrane biosynthesis protein TonB